MPLLMLLTASLTFYGASQYLVRTIALARPLLAARMPCWITVIWFHRPSKWVLSQRAAK